MKILKVLTSITVVLFILTLTFLIGSCASTNDMRQKTPGLPAFGITPTNGKNLHDPVIRLSDETGHFFCTGFVIDGMYAMTAAHCVVDFYGKMRSDTIKIADIKDNYTGEAIAIGVDKYLDVAFLKGDFSDYQTRPVSFNGAASKVGMTVVSCGFPSGQYELYCTQLLHVGNKDFRYRMRGGPLFKGMSSGPVIEVTTGYIIGVNSSVDIDTVIIGPVIGSLEGVGLR